MEKTITTYPTLERCPFCHLLPLLELKGGFWKGDCQGDGDGCAALMKNLVCQSNYESAVNQWNHFVAQRREEVNP